ncbi:hypothetical protein H0A71_05975 [Alcaligenaceae bacterium]|nr:hypothetical protein [Alcaligenaceae bacterium]
MSISTILIEHGLRQYQSPDGNVTQWWRPYLKEKLHPDWIEVVSHPGQVKSGSPCPRT